MFIYLANKYLTFHKVYKVLGIKGKLGPGPCPQESHVPDHIYR